MSFRDNALALTATRQNAGRPKQFDPISRTDGGEYGFLLRGRPPGNRDCDRLYDRTVEIQEALQRCDASEDEPTRILRLDAEGALGTRCCNNDVARTSRHDLVVDEEQH